MKEMIIDYTQQAFPFFLAAAVAFAISCILTPAAIRIAPKIGAMDIPKDNRRMHKKAMPRFGGYFRWNGNFSGDFLSQRSEGDNYSHRRNFDLCGGSRG